MSAAKPLGLGHDPGPTRARRRKHTVIADQVRAGLWHQRGEPGDEVLGLEYDVRRSIPIRPYSRPDGSGDVAVLIRRVKEGDLRALIALCREHTAYEGADYVADGDPFADNQRPRF